jgi:hypothetical protein
MEESNTPGAVTTLDPRAQAGGAVGGHRGSGAISALVARWRALEPYARGSLLVALASRLLVFAVGGVITATMRVHEVNPIMRFPARAELYRGWLGHVLNPWAQFDGVWFIHIANEGYRLDNNTPAFFPLYPLALKAGGVVIGNYQLAGIILSLVFFLAAVLVLYRLVARDLSPRIAFYSVLFVSLSPVSFFFQTVYSESLFLLASVVCFLFVRERRWALAGVTGMLAAATRLAGVFLLLPMMLEYLRQDRSDPRRDRVLFWFLLVPAGVGLYALYLAWATGSIDTFGGAERAWGRDPTVPVVTVWRASIKAYHGLTQLLTGHGVPADPAYVGETLAFVQRETAIVNLFSFVALGVAVVALGLAWRRLPLGYALYGLAIVCLPLFAPRPQVPLMSMPRFVLVAFPVMVAIAVLTDARPRLRWLLVAASVAGLVFLTGRFSLWLFVA